MHTIRSHWPEICSPAYVSGGRRQLGGTAWSRDDRWVDPGWGGAELVGSVAPSYKGFRYPAEIISHSVWLYHRFPLSFREVEEMMLKRGVVVSHETVRQWCAKFGQTYANGLRRRRARPGDKWHLDEVFIKINGALHYLWRAVDQHGEVLDILVQSRRNAKAAKRFFRRLLKGLRYVPRVVVTDKLASYGAAPRDHVVCRAPKVEVLEQSGGKLTPAHPSAGTGHEAVHFTGARAAVPVRLQRHLTTLSTPPSPAARR
jgi:transposase-like protein